MNENSFVTTSKADAQRHRIQMIPLLYCDLFEIGHGLFFSLKRKRWLNYFELAATNEMMHRSNH